MDLIYLDNNATTTLRPEVLDAMRPYLGQPANPSSAHRAGRRARQLLEQAREQLADLLGAHADEVIFTSGATEANNLALTGLVSDSASGPIFANPMEHPSVSEPLRCLQAVGHLVQFFSVDSSGRIEPIAVTAQLVVCQLVNHETGVVQPVEKLVGAAPLHCDATQAVGKIPVHFHRLGATTLALSGHKFHGPAGIGALLVRRGTTLRPQLHGGHQQRGLRPGTEPVALAVGLAHALELACGEMEARLEHVRRLREVFLGRLPTPFVVNGDGLPYTVNVSFPGLPGDLLLMALDLAGVACSTGSACSSGSLLPSPTLQAMGLPEDRLRSAMRFSFSGQTRLDEIEEASRRISAVVTRLRQSHSS